MRETQRCHEYATSIRLSHDGISESVMLILSGGHQTDDRQILEDGRYVGRLGTD